MCRRCGWGPTQRAALPCPAWPAQRRSRAAAGCSTQQERPALHGPMRPTCRCRVAALLQSPEQSLTPSYTHSRYLSVCRYLPTITRYSKKTEHSTAHTAVGPATAKRLPLPLPHLEALHAVGAVTVVRELRRVAVQRAAARLEAVGGLRAAALVAVVGAALACMGGRAGRRSRGARCVCRSDSGRGDRRAC